MPTTSPFQLIDESTHIEVEIEQSAIDVEWANIEQFGTEVVTLIQQRKRPQCLIDLSPLNYMGSALVALIVRIWKVVKAENGQMVVVCPHPVVLQVISLAGLDKLWRVVPTRPAGLKEIGAPIKDRSTQGKAQGLLSNTAASERASGSRFIWPIIGVIIVIVVISILVLKTLNEAP